MNNMKNNWYKSFIKLRAGCLKRRRKLIDL